MSEERCPLSDLLVTECACRVHDPGPAPQQHDGGFPARFPGTCAGCEQFILPGEWITSGSNGGYVHMDCEGSS